jgi:hypothetical protein
LQKFPGRNAPVIKRFSIVKPLNLNGFMGHRNSYCVVVAKNLDL